MRRSAAVVTSALAVLGLGITAAASADPGHHGRGASHARVAVDGLVSDWDADAATVTVDDPDVSGARFLRRLVRRAGEVQVDIGPRTRIVTEDDAGDRTRVTADDLFAALDASADDVEVEAAGLLTGPGDPSAGTDPEITAKRIVVYLPPADAADPADDAGDDPDAPPPGA